MRSDTFRTRAEGKPGGFLLFLVVIGLLIAPAAWAQKTSEPPESMRDFFSQTFPLEATLKQIDADIARFPGRADLWQTRATLLGSHGKTTEALESLEKALALIPDLPPRQGKSPRKGPIIIVQSGPSRAGMLCDIGEIYIQLNRREEAKKVLHRAIDPESPHMLACTLLGNLYLDEGKPEEALKHYDLMKHNLSTSGKISKGNALYNLKRYDEAIKEYEVARHWKPELPSVLQHIGDAYLRVGRLGDALGAYQKFLRVARKQNLPAKETEPVRQRLAKIAQKLGIEPGRFESQPAPGQNLGSSTALAWKTEPLPADGFVWGSEALACVFQSKLWVIVGAFSNPTHAKRQDGKESGVWTSPDGRAWTRVSQEPGLPSLFGATATPFRDRILIIGGGSGTEYNDGIWSSADGAAWSRKPFPQGFGPRSGHRAAVLGGSLYVVGGRTAQGVTSDIWRTSDGDTWEQVPGVIPFPARHGHSLAAFDGRLWVIGGFVGGQANNDVWASRDGREWTLVTEDPPFDKQNGHTTCPLGDRLWLIPAEEYKKQAWSTTDGVGWREEALPTGSGSIRRFGNGQVVVFGDGLVQLGGFQGKGRADNVISFGTLR